MTETLSAISSDAVTRARRVLDNGGLVALPTDTVYGLAADVWNAAAIERLYQVKRRRPGIPVPVLVADVAAVRLVTLGLDTRSAKLAERFWPGPITLLVRKRSELPEAISPTDRVGVRAPDHPVALELLSFGPLAVTSANRSGEPDTRTAAEVEAQLDAEIELILDGGRAPGGVPSTVVDCSGDNPVIVRSGPISEEEIRTVLA